MKEDDKRILEVLKENGGSYERTARRLSISERTIKSVDMLHNGSFNYTQEGRGPQHLQRYIVAIRDVAFASGWSSKDERIIEARKRYDAGEVEIATGRDGFNLILYAIPRREKIRRKPYFAIATLEVVRG